MYAGTKTERSIRPNDFEKILIVLDSHDFDPLKSHHQVLPYVQCREE